MNFSIEQRLLKLEKENRWLKQLVGISALVCVVVCAAGAQIEAPRKLLINDDAGNCRTRMNITADNQVCFEQFDKTNRSRIYIGEGQNGEERIVISDSRGVGRIYLGVNPNGVANLAFYSANGQMTRQFTE